MPERAASDANLVQRRTRPNRKPGQEPIDFDAIRRDQVEEGCVLDRRHSVLPCSDTLPRFPIMRLLIAVVRLGQARHRARSTGVAVSVMMAVPPPATFLPCLTRRAMER